VEDRNSGLKDKIDIKEKTEVSLHKRFKSCGRNTQEFSNSIKRPTLQILGIEEVKEVQAKGICNLFNKILVEISPNLEKDSGTGNLWDTKQT
jgi:hypothetical protein